MQNKCHSLQNVTKITAKFSVRINESHAFQIFLEAKINICTRIVGGQ